MLVDPESKNELALNNPWIKSVLAAAETSLLGSMSPESMAAVNGLCYGGAFEIHGISHQTSRSVAPPPIFNSVMSGNAALAPTMGRRSHFRIVRIISHFMTLGDGLKVHKLLPSMARWAAAGLVALAAFTLVLLISSAEPRVASATGPTTVSYNTVGATTFTVPTGVTSLSVVAVGGGGAGSVQYVGGSGAAVTATLSVTPGQVLDLFVGGSPTSSNWNVGGGGSTSITSGGAPLVIAGGGGGGERFGAGGSALGTGANGAGGSPGLGGAGGIGGAGGSGSPAGLPGGTGYGGKGGDSASAGGAGVPLGNVERAVELLEERGASLPCIRPMA